MSACLGFLFFGTTKYRLFSFPDLVLSELRELLVFLCHTFCFMCPCRYLSVLKLKRVLWLSCVAYGLVFRLAYSARGTEYLGHRSISETTLNIIPGVLLFSLRVNPVCVLFVSS